MLPAKSEETAIRRAFFEAEGNLETVFEMLDRKVSQHTVQAFADEHDWWGMLGDVQKYVDEARKQDQLILRSTNEKILRFLKNKAFSILCGETDPETGVLIKKPLTGEKFIRMSSALQKLMLTERELSGDQKPIELNTERPINFLTLINLQRLEHSETNEDREDTKLDPANRVR